MAEQTVQESNVATENKKDSAKEVNLDDLLNEKFNNLEMSDDTFRNLTDKSVTVIKEDELIKGKIVKFNKDEVLVDIGFKSYGVIPKGELINAESYVPGEEIDVFIEKMEDVSGRILLSRRRADFMRIWEDILALNASQEVTKVKITRRIKGGMVVDLLGIEAFLPGSQIDVRPIRDFDAWVGKSIDVKVVKVNHPSENVVVSHKVLLEEHLAEQREAIMAKLEKGLVLEGVVKAISDFGVFVDLGGIDGLVHITDLSWGRVSHPSEVVDLDVTVKVVVLDYDEEKKRISLGMKQLTPHPWDNIGDKYVAGTKVEGKVVSLTDYGAFIEIEKGVEGLIHISEMSWTQHIKHPSQMVSMGQVVQAVVLNIDKDEKKLALGMKQLTPDPWEDLIKRYPTGSVHRGIVRNLTIFGVFVELEQGVDGLVHISDLSWTKKIRHPGEFVKKGDELDVVVLNIDPELRRISLGHKQLTENPWDTFEDKYKIGTETEAKIERIIEKGIIIELPDGVDGFVPVSQLSFAPVKRISDYFNLGDILPLKVVEFDKEAKKIVLSVVECLRGKDQAIIDKYNEQHPVPNADKFASGSDLPEDVPVYQPGDKEIEEVLKQEFSYPEPPADIVDYDIEEIPTSEFSEGEVTDIHEIPNSERENAEPEEKAEEPKEEKSEEEK
ncbi:MAG: 30S ribosomal protein S1 [Bacteroidetes bacterium]|nr:30S ribosomal protein S1 [Bacteroidota bacterium]